MELVMGLFDSLKIFLRAVDTEYDRRIRAASNVKAYQVGGHGSHDAQARPVDSDRVNGHGSAVVVERSQGEGGVVGDLQANAGPQGDRG